MLTEGVGNGTPLGHSILIFFGPEDVILNVSCQFRFPPYNSMRLSPWVRKEVLMQ